VLPSRVEQGLDELEVDGAEWMSCCCSRMALGGRLAMRHLGGCGLASQLFVLGAQLGDLPAASVKLGDRLGACRDAEADFAVDDEGRRWRCCRGY
jgi:hypothetical protein